MTEGKMGGEILRENQNKKTMSFSLVGNVYVDVHTAEPPSNHEWEAYIADLKKCHDQLKGIFVFTEGGAKRSTAPKIQRGPGGRGTTDSGRLFFYRGSDHRHRAQS